MSAREEPKVQADLIDLMLGEPIGFEGISRTCYVLRTDERYVVKLEKAGLDYFSNFREWTIYNATEGLEWARKWLAKPAFISENGRVLIMERTTPFSGGQKAPLKLPVWLTDYKPENYGWGVISGDFVCHDYGSDMVIANGFSKRLRTVKWRVKDVE